MPRRMLVLLLALFALPSLAAEQVFIQFSSGTGFFINPEGHLITNAHVVKQCQSLSVGMPGGDREAQLIAMDHARDLAVLKVKGTPGAIAPLRTNISDLKVGDAVVLVGFPGAEGAAGRASFGRSRVTAFTGPTGEPLWLQLSSIAQQGNSGGPVLDTTGNVIAVIAGRAETYRTATSSNAKPVLVAKADIAVTLAALEDFLQENGVSFYRAASGMVQYADGMLAQDALRFIAPVRCVHGMVRQ